MGKATKYTVEKRVYLSQMIIRVFDEEKIPYLIQENGILRVRNYEINPATGAFWKDGMRAGQSDRGVYNLLRRLKKDNEL